MEIKIYKQRLKHLLYEHQNELTNKKTEAEQALKMAQDDDREAESAFKEDKRQLMIALKETEFTHDEYIRGLKREQDVKITSLRHEFERRGAEVQRLYDTRMKKTREMLDKLRKVSGCSVCDFFSACGSGRESANPALLLQNANDWHSHTPRSCLCRGCVLRMVSRIGPTMQRQLLTLPMPC